MTTSGTVSGGLAFADESLEFRNNVVDAADNTIPCCGPFLSRAIHESVLDSVVTDCFDFSVPSDFMVANQ